MTVGSFVIETVYKGCSVSKTQLQRKSGDFSKRTGLTAESNHGIQYLDSEKEQKAYKL